jgi:hypothetical protein
MSEVQSVEVVILNLGGSVGLEVRDMNFETLHAPMSVDEFWAKAPIAGWRISFVQQSSYRFSEPLPDAGTLSRGAMDKLREMHQRLANFRGEAAYCRDRDRCAELSDNDGLIRTLEREIKLQQALVQIMAKETLGIWPYEMRDYNL